MRFVFNWTAKNSVFASDLFISLIIYLCVSIAYRDRKAKKFHGGGDRAVP